MPVSQCSSVLSNFFDDFVSDIAVFASVGGWFLDPRVIMMLEINILQ